MSLNRVHSPSFIAERTDTVPHQGGGSLSTQIKSISIMEKENYKKVDALIKKIIELNQWIGYTPISKSFQSYKKARLPEVNTELNNLTQALGAALNEQGQIVQMKDDLLRKSPRPYERTPQSREFDPFGNGEYSPLR